MRTRWLQDALHEMSLTRIRQATQALEHRENPENNGEVILKANSQPKIDTTNLVPEWLGNEEDAL